MFERSWGFRFRLPRPARQNPSFADGEEEERLVVDGLSAAGRGQGRWRLVERLVGQVEGAPQ